MLSSQETNLALRTVIERHGQMLEQCRAYLLVLKDNPQATSIVLSLQEQLQLVKQEIETLEELNNPQVALAKNKLSKREVEVLTLVAKGFPNKEIAYLLTISDRTVQFHLKSVFEKLSVSSRTEAVTEALRLSLITP